MKVALITTDDDITGYGIRSLSAYLKGKGHETQLFFLPSYRKRYLERTLRNVSELINADIIGVSCMALSSDRMIQVVKYLKRLGKPIVWGGVHATICPEECIKHADYVCRGEGEKAFLELTDKLEKGEDVTNVKNIWLKKDRIIKNDVRELIEDIDEIPFSDYDLSKQYVLEGDKIVRLRKEDFRYGEKNQATNNCMGFKGYALVHTTRGCPHSCSYCSNHFLRQMYKGCRYVRNRSMENVIREMEILKEKLELKFFWVTDDTFFVRSREDLEYFSKEYKKRINLPFMCFASPKTFDEEKLKLLTEAGLYRVEIGVQTGSERINREVYNRPMLNEDVIKAGRLLKRYGVKTTYQIITTNPYETEEDMLETIKLLRALPRPYTLDVYGLIFFPGIQLYHKALEEGIIKDNAGAGFDTYYSNSLRQIRERRTNVYLNSVLDKMRGKATKNRIGLIPEFLINPLLKKKIIRLNQHNLWISDAMNFIIPTKARIFFGLPVFMKRFLIRFF